MTAFRCKLLSIKSCFREAKVNLELSIAWPVSWMNSGVVEY